MLTSTGSWRALLSSDRDFRQRSPTHSYKTEQEREQKGGGGVVTEVNNFSAPQARTAKSRDVHSKFG